jgi:hypothetical protein
VIPSGLDYPSGVEVWRTISSVPAGGVFGDAARYEIDLIARMRLGVTIDQAASELAAMTTRLEAQSQANPPFNDRCIGQPGDVSSDQRLCGGHATDSSRYADVATERRESQSTFLDGCSYPWCRCLP